MVEPGEDGALLATIERSVPYDGERVLAFGHLLRDGTSTTAEDAPTVGFLAPADAEGRSTFRPTAAVAFPKTVA
jgi:hypothetical protein